jgi:hypothetical protein
MVSNSNELIHLDLTTKVETHLQDKAEIGTIMDILFDADTYDFYVLCNKYQEKLGLFVIKFNDKNPN